MYEEHFGLTSRPFQLTPDPRFWFETATHRKAMAYLGYGLAQGEGFVVITGEIGAGKTTLVGHLVERIDPARMTVIRLVSTRIEADDLLRIVAAGFGVEHVGKSKAELLAAVERGLHQVARTGRRTLLIVDEAQALPVSALEELRMLSNFQAGGRALLQICLLGQPEFRDRLHGSERLEQLRQRVIATHHLEPMAIGEVEGYVAHRLTLAGWTGRPDFADDAFPALHHASGGVPRRLNQLASRVLLHCAVENETLVDAAMVEAVAQDEARVPRPVPVAPVMAEVAPSATPVTTVSGPVVEEPVAVSVSVDEAPVIVAPPASPAPEPRPMTPPPTVTAPRPIRLAPVAAPSPIEQTPAPATATLSEADQRFAALEARIEEQDAALRRVLTLLVDWVEGDAKLGPATLRDVA